MIQEGFHGTDNSLKENILSLNFLESKGKGHWLGNGVYFFINDGIDNNPIFNAREWAKAEAWDNDIKKHKYLNYVVLKAKVEIKEELYLDLTTNDGLRMLNHCRDNYIEKIKSAGKKINKKTITDDHIIEKMKRDFDFEFVKNNFYIKFREGRKAGLISRLPNVTVLSVSNPEKNILIDYIEVIEEGEIK